MDTNIANYQLDVSYIKCGHSSTLLHTGPAEKQALTQALTQENMMDL